MLYDIIKRPNSDANKVGSRTATQIARFCSNAESVHVNNLEDLTFAIELLRNAKALQDIVMDLTEPFREISYAAYKEVQVEQKGFVEPLEATVRSLRDKVADYRERAARELLVASVELEEAGSDEALVKFNEFSDQVNDIEGIGLEYREYFKVEVVDRDELIKWAVDNDRTELIEVNTKALNKIARRMGDAFHIPGAQAVKSVTPVLRSGNG